MSHRPCGPVMIAILSILLSGCDGGGDAWIPKDPGTGPRTCDDGRAGFFPCSGISLEKRISLDELGGAAAGNDIWGWFDAQADREYALVGLSGGVTFVDVTQPRAPVVVGHLPTQTVSSTWRDIKVYRDHAYIVADGAGNHGMQVFDLTRLRNETAGRSFSPDLVYGEFGNAHNLAINQETGFAYALGTNTCGGGLHMIDLSEPINPLFAGCHSRESETHDAQCVIYRGPDVDYAGREICVNSNGNHLEIVDVDTKFSPVILSAVAYPSLGFVHQGWLTEDHRFFLLGDELDELNLNLPTSTHVIDLSDLDAPQYLFAYRAGTASTDHNLFVVSNRVFEANYTSGLRILEFGDLSNQELAEVAFFDTFPAHDESGFSGAWGVYPYLPSGTVVVSDTINGLFVLSIDDLQ